MTNTVTETVPFFQTWHPVLQLLVPGLGIQTGISLTPPLPISVSARQFWDEQSVPMVSVCVYECVCVCVCAGVCVCVQVCGVCMGEG